MTLINCPKCSRQVSDKAKICPNCAYPISTDKKTGKESLIAEKETLLAEKKKALADMLNLKKEGSILATKSLPKRTSWFVATVSVFLIIVVGGIALTVNESERSEQLKFDKEYKQRFHEVPGYNRYNDGVAASKESDHFNHVSMVQVRKAQLLIKRAGHKCDTCDEMQPFVFGGGFTVHCNNWKYTYEIRDVGGTWEIKVK